MNRSKTKKGFMDFASIIGVILGVGAVVLGNMLEGSHMSAILQLTAAMIVFGGTMGAVVLSFPRKSLRLALSSIREVFTETQKDMKKVIAHIVMLSYKARKDGIIALEEDAMKSDEPFLRRALTLAIDGTDSKMLRETMEIEMENIELELEAPAKVWECAGGIAPTIGILGAVLGLIHVMQNLTDPNKLGGGIAVAFVATVYGVGSANLIFLPMANKLKNKLKGKMAYYEAILEGILAIQNGENPRMIEEKLKGFLDSREKSSFVSTAGKVKSSSGVKVA